MANKGSPVEVRIRSQVAGESKVQSPLIPLSARADVSACLMAKKTELPKNRGGSPTPFEL
jgi:hypothetical protein